MKILLFGTGDYYSRYRKWFAHEEVLALLDNSKAKQHTLIDGVEVLPPEEGVRLKYDSIVILSFYYEQMKGQLASLGVDEEKIFHFYALHRLLGESRIKIPVRYFFGAEEIIGTDETASKVLLVSADLTLGGPAIALFHAAAVLKRRGYEPVFASMWDGPLREKLAEYGIPLVIDENLPMLTMRQAEWARKFPLIICNTMNFHLFLSERDTSVPVIWWLHDARFFYGGVDRIAIGKISMENLTAVSVGPVAEAAVREFLPGMECGELLYGVADMGNGIAGEEGGGVLRFITIGFLEDIKGHDVLIAAVRGLARDVLDKCEFYITGHDRTLFGERMRRESAGIKEVVFTGSVDRGEIHRLLDSAGLLICPSRQDCMPTVAAEAMMHSVPCIVSDATGTAAYIHDGDDGFVFPCGDAAALAAKIEWCVKNRDALESMGKKARKIYERHFSMEAFEERLLEVLDAAGGRGLCQN